ncbi:MAG: hypothetical protein Q8912_05065 [Bacillota bacterium]|nr:hypothetical protein [Bacillota bacterium]
MSLSIQIGMVTSVIGLIVINIANNRNNEEKDIIVDALNTIGIVINALLVVVLIISSKFLGTNFGFHSTAPFFLLGLFLIITTPLTIRNALLQARHDFTGLSISTALSSGFKIIGAVALILLSFGASGAIGGLVLAQSIAYLYVLQKTKAHTPFRKKLFDLEHFYDKQNRKLIFKEVKYGGLVFAAMFSTLFLYTTDILFVKHYFNPAEAGLYGGVSAVARIIFFVTSSIAGVLIATITTKTTHSEGRRILTKGFLLLLAVNLPCYLIFTFAPNLVIRILMGVRFMGYAHFLAPIALAVILASFVNLFFNYFLAKRTYFAAIIAIPSILLTGLMIYLHHATITSVINAYILGGLITLLALLILFVREGKK